ncbi:MAG: TlyA family rRNA (cytidine-2'-O)-methyltransferase [bacterium]|nr:MAG: TlyA family rRNA (cytidine-2'-O)-methyltransferase [bacterium]
MPRKYRLDQLLYRKQLTPSREKARGHILAGNVLINDEVITKVGCLVDENVSLRLKVNERYVSRGGLKLEKAIQTFSIDVNGLIALDVGSSTGGFTDCLLQHGVQQVYSVDVGYNQLDYHLRNHDQVIVMEKLNAKNLDSKLFDKAINLAVIDVSFISLTRILSSVLSVLKDKEIIALIKPQFEVGRQISGFKGVVRLAEDHLKALHLVNDYALSIGLFTQSLTYSPMKGPKGNMEFLIHWSDHESKKLMDFKSLVNEAHQGLSGCILK